MEVALFRGNRPVRGEGVDHRICMTTEFREPITLVAVALVVRELMCNEETLFPTALGFDGWKRPLMFFEDVYLLGWEEAVRKHGLRAEHYRKEDVTDFCCNVTVDNSDVFSDVVK